MATRNKRHSASWSVVEAKSRLDEVIEEADYAGPQTLVKNSDEQAVIVPADTWGTRQRRNGTLAEFFHNSPLRGLDIDFERHPDTELRDIDL